MVLLDEVLAWRQVLPAQQKLAVDRYLKLLAEEGIALGFPYSSKIEGSAIGLRELRVKAGKAAIRIFYVFDRRRQAIVLLGGNKAGAADKRFYRNAIPRAEALYRAYLKTQE